MARTHIVEEGETNGLDEPTDRDRVRERLFEADRLGFRVAGVWPSVATAKATPGNPDPLHYTPEALEGIKDYQLNRRPKGKP